DRPRRAGPDRSRRAPDRARGRGHGPGPAWRDHRGGQRRTRSHGRACPALARGSPAPALRGLLRRVLAARPPRARAARDPDRDDGVVRLGARHLDAARRARVAARRRPAWTALGVGAVLYLGIVITGLGSLVWNWALERVSAARAAIFLNLQPLVGTLLGVW